MSQNPYLEGRILIVDKPINWTSFDVVKKIRYSIKKKYGLKKIKVGHAGTLDPLATGLLIICTGKMTKSIDQFLNEKKGYIGKIKLGATTPSFDLETDIDKNYDVPLLDENILGKIETQFLGDSLQEPPLFSAKKINGKRAYTLARANVDVKLEAKPITIFDLKLSLIDADILNFECVCSKGTYIRSLARDIGLALGSGAHLKELRRISSGKFHISDAKSVQDWLDIIKTS